MHALGLNGSPYRRVDRWLQCPCFLQALMWTIVEGSTHNLDDVQDFISLLNALPQHRCQSAREFLLKDRDVTVARAPGRLDVMGGIADYSGSLVLQLPLNEATFVAVQTEARPLLQVLSLGAEGEEDLFFELPLEVLPSTVFISGLHQYLRGTHLRSI